MSSTRLDAFRSFLTEKFMNVVAEIFEEVETIVETYYEENKRQRTILQMTLNPQIQLSKIDVGQHTGATADVKKQTPQQNTWVQPEGAEPLPEENEEEQTESDKNSKADDLLTICGTSDPGEEENINMPYIVNFFHIPAADLKPDFTASHSGEEAIYGHEDISSIDRDAENVDVVAEGLTLCRSEGGKTECGEPQNNLNLEKIKSKHLSTKQTPTKPCLQETRLELPSGDSESAQTVNDALVPLPPVLQLKSQHHRPPHGHCNDVGQHTGATADVKKQTPQQNNTWVQPEGAEPLPKENEEEQIESDRNSKADDLLTICGTSDPGEEENKNMPYIVNFFHIPAADLKPDFTTSHSGEEAIYGHEDISSIDCDAENVDVVAESLTLCRSEGGKTECGEPQNKLNLEKIKSKHLSTKQTPTKPCLQETRLELPSGDSESAQTVNDAPVPLPPVLQLKSQHHCPPHGHCNEFSDTLNITTSESSHSRSTRTLDEIPNKRQRLDDPPDAMLARRLVEGVLKKKSGGEEVLQEYQATETLPDATRKKMVNILVTHMIDIHGLIPSKSIKELYALGIVMLFPSLKDPCSLKGYEYFYDATGNTGHIAWRLTTVKRKLLHVLHSSKGGPECRRATNVEGQLDGDACNEAISLLKQTTDETLILQKMRETFQHRQKLVSGSDRTADIFFTFPRFLNTKGLVEQDFTLLFGEETSSRFLHKWDRFFRPKIIKEARQLTSTSELRQLLLIAESPPGLVVTTTSDQEMSSILLLLHLLPQPPGEASKISACDASQRLVVFHQSNGGFKETVNSQTRQYPYLVAVGSWRTKIDSFYIAVDKHLIPCQSNRFLGAFDELFKAHFVFNLSYDAALVNFYTFLQTTVYNIDRPET